MGGNGPGEAKREGSGESPDVALEHRLTTLETTTVQKDWLRDEWWPGQLEELEKKFVGRNWLLAAVIVAMGAVIQALVFLILRWISGSSPQ